MYQFLILLAVLLLLCTNFDSNPFTSLGGAMSPGVNDQMNSTTMFVTNVPRIGNPGQAVLGPAW